MNLIKRAFLILLALVGIACGRVGANLDPLAEGEVASWRFARGGVASQGAAASGGFEGRLDVLWERGLKEKPQGAITMSNGAIALAGAKRRIFLFNPENGETLTKFKNRSSPQSGGLLVDSLLYNSTSPPFNYLDCRAVSNGKLRWRSVILDITAPLLSKDERLFALGGDGVIYCIDRFSGDLLWEKKVGGKMISAPALESRSDGDLLWIANSNGWIGAFDAASGKEFYKRVMGESLVSSPAVGDDGTIYFSGQGGHAFALSRQVGSGATAVELAESIFPADPLFADSKLADSIVNDSFILAESVLKSASWSSPALKDGFVVFVDNVGNVYCYDSPSLSKVVWQVPLNGALVASPIIVGDFVIVGLLTGDLYSLRLETGEIISSRRLESPIKYSPISDGERVYVATQRKSLYCFGRVASTF